jgi:P-loop containing NTP hydrolase pore-1
MINLSCSAAAMATSAVVRAAQLLLSDLEHGRRIDAAGTLRAAMETAVGASDAGGAWHWKAAYDACEAATVLFLRKYASSMRAKAAWPASMLSMLAKVASLIPTHTYRSELSRLRQGTPIRLSEGILFTTYATLRSDERGEKLSRVRQIVEWLGPDFGGVVVFDESHAMQNAAGGKGERGDQAASQQGRAGLRLQHALPNARVVYVSATGATTLHNLGYAQRLGLWGGEDFPFARRAEFVEAIEEGGVAAMEVLARDLKALGLYAARSPSYEGVEYELIEHELTPEQIRIYDAYAGIGEREVA